MIRNLIAPALDSLRQMALWRTAGMIPGIGNAVNAVTELVAGSAVLIRNCFGVTAMLVLLAAGMVPAVQLLVSGLPSAFSPRRRSPSRTSGSRDVLRRQEKDMRCFCVSF